MWGGAIGWRNAFFDGPRAGVNGFRLSAALSLTLQALHSWRREGLWGGGDLVPHLRLIELTQQEPGLHNTYAPAYHVLGALVEPVLGFEAYTRLFALGAAALLIAGFRAFQRAAGLPDAAASLFALTPYVMSLSWCTPKVEAAGYALLLFGLAGLLRGRHARVALLLAAAFAVHTASALLFGLAGGVLCVSRGDWRGLLALAVGTLGATPLLAAQLAAGCSPAEALLFARGGYARALHEGLVPRRWPWLIPLANPVALAAALWGATALWRHQRSLGILCAVLVLVYLNNFWLAPFGHRTLVTPLRGLSVLAIPIAIAAGNWTRRSAGVRAWVVGLSALFAVAASVWVVPQACFVREIRSDEIGAVQVQRCSFLWRRSGTPQGPRF